MLTWLVVERRGLPHAHILLMLTAADKPRNVDDYDRFLSADPATYPQVGLLAGCVHDSSVLQKGITALLVGTN
jgi:hypothetical protein